MPPEQVVAYVAERAEAARSAGLPCVLWDVLRVLAAHGSLRTSSAKQGRAREQDSPGPRRTTHSHEAAMATCDLTTDSCIIGAKSHLNSARSVQQPPLCPEPAASSGCLPITMLAKSVAVLTRICCSLSDP